jgi:hypothetical protein
MFCHQEIYCAYTLRIDMSPIAPVPFVTVDYVLCAIAFLLVGIASSVQIAALVEFLGR